MLIKIRFSTIDGVARTHSFKTLAGARKFAADKVGPQDVEGGHYAVSNDGVAKVTWAGCTRSELFGEVAAPVAAEPGYVAIRSGRDSYKLYCGKVCPATFFATAYEALDNVTGDHADGWALKSDSYGLEGCFDPDQHYPTLAQALAYAKGTHKALMQAWADEAHAEQQAEGAWLRAAEMGTAEDMHFEDMERQREAFYR
jgi:hypothetical protein